MLTDILKAVTVTAELTGYPLSEAALDLMVQDLDEYPEPQVMAALKRCRQECKGRLTLHEIIQRMDLGDVDHPGPEEAWGLLIRFVNDERETGLYTEPMRHAWEACDPILKAGDEVGARMCFLETYRKALKRAVETRNPPKWNLTMGSDVERRKSALEDAVAAKRISADYAQSLLPAPVASLEHLAGLLEHDGPKPEPGQPSFRERLHDLAAQLRSRQTDDEPAAPRSCSWPPPKDWVWNYQTECYEPPLQSTPKETEPQPERPTTLDTQKARIPNLMDQRLRRAA